MKKSHLNHDEMQAIMGVLSPNKGDASLLCIEFLALCGLRTEEFISLTVGDIGKKRGNVHLWRGAKGSTGRVLRLPNSFLDKMQRVGVFNCGEDVPVYIALGYEHSGGSTATVKRRLRHKWAQLLESVFDYKIKLGLHALRHTFCIQYFKASGNDLIATQHAMGHKNVQNTIGYLESVNEKRHLDITRDLYNDLRPKYVKESEYHESK